MDFNDSFYMVELDKYLMLTRNVIVYICLSVSCQIGTYYVFWILDKDWE